ncbi:MAG: exosortase-associated EpsI family protein [Tepidisphaerales bacterium]
MTQGINPSAQSMAVEGLSSAGSRDGSRLFGSGFLLVFVVLSLAAIGLNTAVSYLQLHFKKSPVPMRGKLQEIPEVLGDWVQVAREDTLEPDMLSALGTDQYLFCAYVNSRKLGKKPEEIRQDFAPKSIKAKKLLLNGSAYRGRDPSAVLVVALTYYTGKADTVAHIPERCYVGDGFDPEETKDRMWALKGRSSALPVRSIVFRPQDREKSAGYNVAYFFNVNGKYSCDSLDVRGELQNLFNRYGYYAKVEMMCIHQDPGKAEEAMKDFLVPLLPQVEAVLPDWSRYKSR